MLAQGARAVAGDAVPVEEEVKDPYILEVRPGARNIGGCG